MADEPDAGAAVVLPLHRPQRRGAHLPRFFPKKFVYYFCTTFAHASSVLPSSSTIELPSVRTSVRPLLLLLVGCRGICKGWWAKADCTHVVLVQVTAENVVSGPQLAVVPILPTSVQFAPSSGTLRVRAGGT